MKHSEELRQQLHSIHRRSYPAYKDLKGQYSFGNYILSIDHVQGDPFASPSHISVRIAHKDAAFPQEYYKDTLSRTTLCDYLTRQFEKLYFPRKRLRKKRPDLCQPLRAGSPRPNCLRNQRKRNQCQIFYRLPCKRPHHQCL